MSNLGFNVDILQSIHSPLHPHSTTRSIMSKPSQAILYRWNDMPIEKVTNHFSRRIITGDRMMLTHVYMKEGCIVPRHSHDNEQLTYVLEGTLRFWLGADESEELDVHAGDVLFIPSNVPHRALALVDTLDVDIFCPPRQDWLDKTDDYLRNQD